MRFAISIFIFLSSALISQVCAQQKVEVSIDLINIKKDRAHVTVIVPQLKQQKLTWCFPAIVPGTYARYDYGRFINNLKAYDTNNNRIDVARKGINEYIILDAEKLQRIEYNVSDTWDASSKENYIFQPAGTYLEKGKVSIINHFGFIGFIDGYQHLPYEVLLKKPYDHISTSSLPIQHIDKGTDKEFANSYFHLADSPTMIGPCDTLSFRCSNSLISISVISANKNITAKQMKECLQPISNALAKFFQILPVNHYNFLFYFADPFNQKISCSGGSGALEHNYSSFYFLPALDDSAAVNELVKDVTAHEFLHILTPLNIHSKEIENFNYLEPKMSKHLWMYEGVTEYFSHLIQFRSHIINEDEFIRTMHDKIENAKDFPSFSFTEMSKNVCMDSYKELYDDVYQKGATMAFLLDIELLHLSGRNFGLPDLMKSLANKYGPEKPFIDDSLFSEIARLTHPKIMDFFMQYVNGKTDLPYKEYFEKIGWTFHDSIQDSVYSFGRFNLYMNNDKQFWTVTNCNDANLFNLKEGDKIISINGIDMRENAPELIEKMLRPVSNTKVTINVLRKRKNIELNAVPMRVKKMMRNKITKNAELDRLQLEMRQKLFGFNEHE
jgi:predicted metalloprotease with PDZ domain